MSRRWAARRSFIAPNGYRRSEAVWFFPAEGRFRRWGSAIEGIASRGALFLWLRVRVSGPVLGVSAQGTVSCSHPQFVAIRAFRVSPGAPLDEVHDAQFRSN